MSVLSDYWFLAEQRSNTTGHKAPGFPMTKKSTFDSNQMILLGKNRCKLSTELEHLQNKNTHKDMR